MALIPIFTASAPSDIPQDSRILAAILWVLCLVPSWQYLQLPEHRRPPVPLMPLIGLAYLFYYPMNVALGQSNVNYLFVLDPTVEYKMPVQYALAGWVALLVGYFGAAPLRINSPFRSVRPTDLATLRVWGNRLLWGGLACDAARQALPVPLVLRGLLYFTSMVSLLGISLLVILAVQK